MSTGSLLPQSPIIAKWKEILRGLKKNQRSTVVRGAAWEIGNASVIEVEDHIVILETPMTITAPSQRHFVALDAITSITRDLLAEDLASEDADGVEAQSQ